MPFALPGIPNGAAGGAAGDDTAIEDPDNNGGAFAVLFPPYDLSSSRYAKDLEEVRDLGAWNSTSRDQDQTNVAFFWAQGGGTSTPPGMWQEIAAQILDQRVAAGETYTLANQARLFAQLTAAQADAAISCWWTKFRYNRWRPISAIRNANRSQNRHLDGSDPAWRPLLDTPPFPSYTSGHSTFSGVSARVLADWFGRDRVTFSCKTEHPNIPDRTFSSFSAAAREAGMSRIYGGIHTEQDNGPALKLGRKIGRYVTKNTMRPLRNRGNSDDA